jgi:hypothetical protein
MKYDLNLLLQFCNEHALSFEANYQEGSGELELCVFGLSPSDYYYMKRVGTIEGFIKIWKEKGPSIFDSKT